MRMCNNKNTQMEYQIITNGFRAAIEISFDFEIDEDIFTLGLLFVLRATALLLIFGKLRVPAPGFDSFLPLHL